MEDKGCFHIRDGGTITTNYNTKDVLDYRTPRSIIDNEWKAQRIVNDIHGEREGRRGKGGMYRRGREGGDTIDKRRRGINGEIIIHHYLHHLLNH